MRIGNNISAMNTLNRLSFNNGAVAKSLEKLSSGSAINRAADDAAGLAISEKMRAQIAGLERAEKNAQDGISLVQTAEGNLDQTHVALRRMYSLAMQAKNGTISTTDREKIQAEIDQRITEIDRVADTANFNGIKLFDGTLDSTFAGQAATPEVPAQPAVEGAMSGTGATTGVTVTDYTGYSGDKNTNGAVSVEVVKSGTDFTIGGVTATVSGNTITATVDGLEVSIDTSAGGIGLTDDGKKTVTLGTVAGATPEVPPTPAMPAKEAGESLVLHIGATPDDADAITVDIRKMYAADLGVDALDLTTTEGASDAMKTIEAAIEKVSVQRGDLGAVQNRLEQTIENLKTANENMSAAESRIRDADMAKEITTFTKFNILSQAAQAMLAQANAQPQGVLQLLG